MEKNEVKIIKVKLLKPHHHSGISYSEGTEIEVLEHDANWLKNLKIAEEVKTSTATPVTKTIEDK